MLKAIMAGILIGIAGLVNLSINIPYLGAFLFSTGLLIICYQQYNLYTGKIGYIKSLNDFKNCLIYLIGNLIGVFCVGIIPQTTTILNKINQPWYLTLWLSIGCGILIYYAVVIFKKHNSVIGILLCVPTFIICGFNHCIANMYYIITSREFTIDALIFIIICIIGNSIGSLICNYIDNLKKI